MATKNEHPNLRIGSKWVKITAAAFVLPPLIYWLWFQVLNGQSLSTTTASWGEFGDFMGGLLNPLVAAAALYWLIQSVRIQQEELRETRDILEEQGKTLEKQRFEDTFFSMLDQHNKTLFELNHRSDTGRTIMGNIHRDVFGGGVSSISQVRARLRTNDAAVGHYFRTLYQILKLIKTHCPSRTSTNGLPDADEKVYANIVRAFIDSSTFQLLAINCATRDENDPYIKYKCLIERYSFLEHMPLQVLGRTDDLSDLVEIYDSIAFGENVGVRTLKACIDDFKEPET